LDVFGRAGYAGTRLADVARAAGVSKATLYLYFASKEALFRAMIRTQAQSVAAPDDLVAGFFPDTPEKKLRRFLRSTWRALQQPELRAILRLIHAEQARFPELGQFYREEIILPIRAGLLRVLDAGCSAGVFRPTLSAAALHGVPALLLHQTLLWEGLAESDPARLSEAELVEGTLDLLLDGLRRRGSRGDAE